MTDQTNDQTTEQTAAVALPENAKKTKFFFKTVDLKDDEGNVIAKDFKHPDVEGVLPVPTYQEIVVSLQSRNPDGTPTKVAAMLKEHVEALIESAAKAQIAAWREEQPPKSVFQWTNLDVSKLTLEAIANLPKGQRGTWAPTDEDLKAFTELYAQVMVGRVSYDEKKVKVHCAHFMKGMTKMKTDKAALAKMQELLTACVSQMTEEEAEEVADTTQWLKERITKYMEYKPKNYSDGL